ncbi:MAG: adenosylcobalamin-dependent ribonucleoside-diphosphate reductase [Dehalococcoidia bacterium]|nr:adenosylcobalamin-dependent ribonucleoside-diphosphate reductase [Dehalococcoidia bacterium]
MTVALQLSENALAVLKARYLISEETPGELFQRVAKHVAQAEPPSQREQWAENFYDLMASSRFMPNSPTLFNAGTGQGTLSACFVIPVDDTMESIMHAATVSAMIQKFGGGIGYSFSRLRSRGSGIATTQGRACGAVAVLKMLSSLSDMITQGGKRHGANMGILDVSHPEIMDFIHMKDDNQTAQNFNISVAVTDAFLQAVKENADWGLIDPHSQAVVSSLPARHIWEEIVQSAWKTGDPGLFFIDEANRRNPTPHLGRMESTNPCGEVPLLPFEACNLGSISLAKFVHEEGIPWFDFTALEQVVRQATRFLDDVVTMNQFPAVEVAEAVARTRKIGLGVMGWHDALIALGIPYDAPQALELADQVMGLINRVARQVSIDLARERGPYPACREEVPVRNSTRTCIAPTGSISAICSASSGIEPIFALAYVKNVLDGQRLQEVNPYFVRVAQQRGFYSDDLMKEVTRTGSCQHIPQVPEDVKRLFRTAMEIDFQTHTRMQATFQKHTDLAVSKTINMANDATVEDVDKTYQMASRLGCIGITVYRDGSKPTQVLEVQRGPGEAAAQKAAGKEVLAPRERPTVMTGVTERLRTGHGNMYITINFDEQSKPFEVFTTLGKAGGCDSAHLEAISRLVSLALRSGVKPDAVVEQLRGITCDPAWDGGTLIRSAPDAVALALSRHLQGEGHPTGRAYSTQPPLFTPQGNGNGNGNGHAATKAAAPTRYACPECSGPLAFQEGCVICHSCGWNECGG